MTKQESDKHTPLCEHLMDHQCLCICGYYDRNPPQKTLAKTIEEAQKRIRERPEWLK